MPAQHRKIQHPIIHKALHAYVLFSTMMFNILLIIVIAIIASHGSIAAQTKHVDSPHVTGISYSDNHPVAHQGQLIQTFNGQKHTTKNTPQGKVHVMSFSGGSVCTLGYVDSINHIAFTAKHCVDKVGDRIHDYKGNYIGDVALIKGVPKNSYYSDDADVAVIVLHDDVDVHHANGISGEPSYGRNYIML